MFTAARCFLPVVLLCAMVTCVAQVPEPPPVPTVAEMPDQTVPTPAQNADFPPAFLHLGWSWTNPGQNAAAVAYAHKTSLFNGSTNLPMYSYSQGRGYACLFRKPKVGTVAVNCTDYTTGMLIPFYDRTWFGGKVRTTLAIVGEAGVTQTPTNVGYTIGADVLAHLTLPKVSKHWGFLVSSDIGKSSVGGISASRAQAGLTYSFAGFTAP